MHSRGRRPSVPGIATLSLAAALAVAGCSSSGSDAVEPAQTLETVTPTDAPATDATDAAPSEPVDTSADSAAPTTAETPATTAATAAALVEPSVGLEAVGTFTRPVDVAVRPAGGRLFVIGQNGTVTAADDATVVLDVSDRITSAGNEQGLL